MRRWLLGSLLVLGGLPLGPASGKERAHAKTQPAIWLDRWETAQYQARRSGKPLLVVFR